LIIRIILFKKQVILLSLAFLFLGCQDNYLTKVYNEDLVNKPITCMKLKLSPYSKEAYKSINSLYKFSEKCDNTLKISYNSNIACNSEFNTNKSFDSYINIELLNNDKLVYSVYKDFKDSNISIEIKKGYDKLCKKIKI